MDIKHTLVEQQENQTKRIKVCESPPTWIEVPAEISDRDAINHFLFRHKKNEDLLEQKIFERRYSHLYI